MKKLIFVCTLLGVSHFGLDTTYGMDDRAEHNIEQHSDNQLNNFINADEGDTDNLDPYDLMYQNRTEGLTEAEICTFVNASVSALCTMGSFLIMGGKICLANFDSDVDIGNRINTMINQILIFTGIGIAANVVLKYFRPDMTNHERGHHCMMLSLLLATAYTAWSAPDVFARSDIFSSASSFVSNQTMYGLATLGGFFLSEALGCI